MDEGRRRGHRFLRGSHQVAQPDPSAYPPGTVWDDSDGYHQWGRCESCDLWLQSVAKKALCPKCGRRVYLT